MEKSKKSHSEGEGGRNGFPVTELLSSVTTALLAESVPCCETSENIKYISLIIIILNFEDLRLRCLKFIWSIDSALSEYLSCL